jgi:hypothetical protein
MLPWPRDLKCKCGRDLAGDFKCCASRIQLGEHANKLSRHYVIYCPTCKEALSGASCEECGRVYTWKLGMIDSYRGDQPRKEQKQVRSIVMEAGEQYH